MQRGATGLGYPQTAQDMWPRRVFTLFWDWVDSTMSGQCQHVFVYERPLWGAGYNIACRKCGEAYGSSETADPNLLAGFNRNRRILFRRISAGPRMPRAGGRPQ